LNLLEVLVRPVNRLEEPRFQHLMQQHHYLGSLPKISETLWYVATLADQWVALLSFSAAALKCSARDRWIGWDFRHRYDRLKLLTNNSRFLILPDWHIANLGSRILSVCQKRLATDWQASFGHPLLLETFVDPQRFQGTIYKAANWIYVGDTKGFYRTRQGYSATAASPKMVFVKALTPDARGLLSQPILEPAYHTGGSKLMLRACPLAGRHRYPGQSYYRRCPADPTADRRLLGRPAQSPLPLQRQKQPARPFSGHRPIF
jgi:hypothetical protein